MVLGPGRARPPHGSAGVVVNIVDKSAALPSTVLLGERMVAAFEPAVVSEWVENLASDCPRMRAAASDPAAPYLVDGMLLTEAEMDRNPVYEFYTRHDIRYMIGAGLLDSERLHVNFSLERSNRQGHADTSDIDLFLLFKPHLRRSLAVALQIGSLAAPQPTAAAMLDFTPHALFALDRKSRILLANRKAERLLASGDLCAPAAILRAALPDEETKLQRLIATAHSGAGGWMRLSRTSGRSALLISVLPVSADSRHPPAKDASVLVFVQDPAERDAAPPRMLIDLFGLTAAEARLASAVSMGHSVESAAHFLGLSVETVRSYLKSIFHKVGVSRQADLARLLASLPAADGTASD